ncbi:hypothetical protein SVIOM342S_01424 [Streptomyces violaceorubidus]
MRSAASSRCRLAPSLRVIDTARDPGRPGTGPHGPWASNRLPGPAGRGAAWSRPTGTLPTLSAFSSCGTARHTQPKGTAGGARWTPVRWGTIRQRVVRRRRASPSAADSPRACPRDSSTPCAGRSTYAVGLGEVRTRAEQCGNGCRTRLWALLHSLEPESVRRGRAKPMSGAMPRMGTIVRAKATKALVRAEDPRETLDYAHQKQRELLQEARRRVADVATGAQSPGPVSSTIARPSRATCRTGVATHWPCGREDLAHEALARRTALPAAGEPTCEAQPPDAPPRGGEARAGARQTPAGPGLAAFRTNTWAPSTPTYTAAQAQTTDRPSAFSRHRRRRWATSAAWRHPGAPRAEARGATGESGGQRRAGGAEHRGDGARRRHHRGRGRRPPPPRAAGTVCSACASASPPCAAPSPPVPATEAVSACMRSFRSRTAPTPPPTPPRTPYYDPCPARRRPGAAAQRLPGAGRLRARHGGGGGGVRRRGGGPAGRRAAGRRGADGHPDARHGRSRRHPHDQRRPVPRPRPRGHTDHLRGRRLRGAVAARRCLRLPGQGLGARGAAQRDPGRGRRRGTAVADRHQGADRPFPGPAGHGRRYATRPAPSVSSR